MVKFFDMAGISVAGLGMIILADGLLLLLMLATIALGGRSKRVELSFDEILNKFCVLLRRWRVMVLM